MLIYYLKIISHKIGVMKQIYYDHTEVDSFSKFPKMVYSTFTTEDQRTEFLL